jgi:hypothetical protein
VGCWARLLMDLPGPAAVREGAAANSDRLLVHAPLMRPAPAVYRKVEPLDLAPAPDDPAIAQRAAAGEVGDHRARSRCFL